MKEEHEELEVKTSLGSLKATGNTVVIVIMIAICGGGLALMIRDQEARAMERAGKITGQITTIKESMDENTYVQTLTPEEKKNLKLDMPPSLRNKVRGSHD